MNNGIKFYVDQNSTKILNKQTNFDKIMGANNFHRISM